jgi:tetratricopeptide (TPR) repeat protein
MTTIGRLQKGIEHRVGVNMQEENDLGSAKAKAFFDRAIQVAERKNFDYAVEMYIEGLRYDPEALEQGHLPLFELALRRRGEGGKKPSMMQKVKRLGGKNALEQMLNAEFLFAKDPNHLPYAEAMLKAAVAGGYNKVVHWIANLIFQMNNAAEKPSLQTYILLKDSYRAISEFDKAVAACQHIVRIKPHDKELADEYKNLSAELTMARGKYETEEDFRKAIKDREEQEKLHSQAGVVKTEDYRIKALEDARKKIAQNPDLPANIFELANALSEMDNDDDENDAIALLKRTYEAKNDFSFRQRAGELRIKQLRRKIQQAKSALETNPGDQQTIVEVEKLTAKLEDTEMGHYKLCTQNYPTNLRLKYEYARHLVKNEMYDEAIPLFQQAQKDPRRKIAAMNQIGYCFFKKGWLADAIDVYTKAINLYELKDDAIGKELRYNLALAYEQQGKTQEALDVYRKIAQADFTYRDVSQRVDRLRSSETESTSQ